MGMGERLERRSMLEGVSLFVRTVAGFCVFVLHNVAEYVDERGCAVLDEALSLSARRALDF